VSRTRGSPVPWRVSDAVTLAACTFVGASVVIFAWYGASGTDRLSAQVEWADLAVVGALVAAAGNVVWVLSGRRAVGLRRAAQMEHLGLFLDSRLAVAGADESPTLELLLDAGLVAVKGLTLYHRADCPLVSGRRVARYTARNGSTREPCGVCIP
jgi:hypothetical protein